MSLHETEARRKYQRELLRRKRCNPDYLERQRINRAAQMRIIRDERKRLGLCHDCEQKRLAGHVYCRFHVKYYRARRYYRKVKT